MVSKTKVLRTSDEVTIRKLPEGGYIISIVGSPERGYGHQAIASRSTLEEVCDWLNYSTTDDDDGQGFRAYTE